MKADDKSKSELTNRWKHATMICNYAKPWVLYIIPMCAGLYGLLSYEDIGYFSSLLPNDISWPKKWSLILASCGFNTYIYCTAWSLIMFEVIHCATPAYAGYIFFIEMM